MTSPVDPTPRLSVITATWNAARTIHVEITKVLIEGAGVSRKNVLPRLREQREVLAHCEGYGPFRAYPAWADKLWRYPIARLLNIPH